MDDVCGRCGGKWLNRDHDCLATARARIERLRNALEKMKLSLEPWQEERGTPEDRFLWELRVRVTEALKPTNQKESE